ncbi:NAD(P)/FAD-dependent oxidoreductase [Tropicimonas isoalkanivorans]|uniref:Gamma-glutamylputrescine oxidase n=1 Tax=Tropicimonas isoalkanivorans TaxID=441112 RepID=A0A1I1JEN9_9RHOB|nr:FAD-binding oxidoreductase [Tropicimonas isoalkanivorans]SFC46825.1 gamma-glutamylputrescine oxidase [Tropicimonas isoalkanivorans]
MDLLTANDRPGEYPQSYYAAHAKPLPPFPAAEGDVRCDVCVVGGGFTGLSAAFHLAERGFNVVLLEAQRVGFGASGRNGGQVWAGQRMDQDALEAAQGHDDARTLWDISLDAVDLVRKLTARPEMEGCTYHAGLIHADHRARFVPETQAYVETLRERYDYRHVRFLGREEIRSIIGTDAYHGGFLDTNSGHLDPLRFALGLARMAASAGVRIFERSKVTGLEPGAPARLRTDSATVTADHVVLGCNGYLGDLDPHVAARVMPINNFIVATEPMTAEQQASIIRGGYAVGDSRFVVNYYRFSEDRRLLFGGGENYSYRFPTDIRKKVSKPMLELFPHLKDTKLDYAWGGTLAITMNRMPHFARRAGNVLSLSGYSGHGVAMGTLAGQIAAEAIAGQAERFDVMARVPTPRFPGGSSLRSPLLALAMLWYSLRDRI